MKMIDLLFNYYYIQKSHFDSISRRKASGETSFSILKLCPTALFPELEAREGHKANIRFIDILNCKWHLFHIYRGLAGWVRNQDCSICHVKDIREGLTRSSPFPSPTLFLFIIVFFLYHL